MGLANGVHHLAICTKDIKTQIEFFTQVVGAELVALYWMHGVDNTFHGFLRLNNSSSIAFVQHPDIAKIQPIKGVSHAGNHRGQRCSGRHAASRAQCRYRGRPARDSRPRALASATGSWGRWITDSASRFISPRPRASCSNSRPPRAAPSMPKRGSIPKCRRWRESAPKISCATSGRRRFESKGGKVAQPKPDPSKPMMQFPPDAAIWTMPDEEVTRRMSETTPPVQKKVKAA